MVTCQIAVLISYGTVMKERVLLNCSSSTLFFMECLAQRLHLPIWGCCVQVAGVGGPEHVLSFCSLVTLTVMNQDSVKTSRLSRR